MYTVEFEMDASVITTMDESAKFEDVEVILGEDGEVFIRQFDHDANGYDMIILSYQQFLDIYSALSSTEGMHKVVYRRK